MFSIIIPACNEEAYLPACLAALLAQDGSAGDAQIIVSANACTDATVEIARRHAPAFAERGWRLDVIDRDEGGKPGALNAGDAIAVGDNRLYLDADIVCDSALVGALRAALDTETPRYATGRMRVARARSWISRQYGRFWQQLPFVRGGAVGTGAAAVNAAGRARWGAFPPIIADDTFIRLQFTPAERIEVDAGYQWPIIEGLRPLVRVRHRQNNGMRQLFDLYPSLAAREGKSRLGPTDLIRLALADPVGFLVYGLVRALAAVRAPTDAFARGR